MRTCWTRAADVFESRRTALVIRTAHISGMSRRERKRRGRWETYNSEFNSEEGFSNSSVDKQVEKEAAAPVPKAASHNLNGENVAVITDEFGGKDYRSDMPLKVIFKSVELSTLWRYRLRRISWCCLAL
ncbi:hypothetical protein ANCCAN_14663, partial [Ancylostoma caninum]